MNGEILKKERKKYGLTQAELGVKMGVKQQAICKWEKNESEPSSENLSTLASMYGVTVDYLLGRESAPTAPDVSYSVLHLLSEVACGAPNFTEDDYEELIVSNMHTRADFCVRAKGDSMINARIYDGDVVFVRKQEMVDNGEIAVVAIDDSATIKRVYYTPQEARLVLMPENPTHKPLVYIGEELERVRILGKVVGFYSEL